VSSSGAGDRRWGIIGSGRVAHQFARAISDVPGHRVQAVASRTTSGAEAFVRDVGIEALATDSLDQVFAAEVEYVYVASPNDRHAEHIAAARRAGLPVLCEKPLAASGGAAFAIRAEVGDSAPKVGVAFQYRQHPAHRRAREIIASGALGELRLVEVSACLPALDVPDWYRDRAVSGGGILPMSGVHRIDLARYIVQADFGRVGAVTAHRRGDVYDDTAAIAASFSDGTACTFLFGLDAPFGDDRLAIHGTNGSVLLESTMSQWWSSVPGSLTLRTVEGVEVETFDDVDNYGLQAVDFARFVDGEPNGIATLDDAVAVADFTEAVYAADASRRLLELPSRV
jgi:predicted dehydrogenase